MSDLFNLVMLILASIGAMAFGILSAYAILRVGFALIAPQPAAIPVKTSAPQAARVS